MIWQSFCGHCGLAWIGAGIVALAAYGFNTELVATPLADTKARTADLNAFAGELEALLAQLSMHQPDGPCDDDCGCLTADTGLDVTAPRSSASPDDPPHPRPRPTM